MDVDMVVAGLTLDPANQAPIVVLREKDGARVLPIWIGVVEASAIAFELEQVKLTRPMTHDLLRATIESLGGAVQHIAIVDLREGTYYAAIRLARGDQTIDLDARPSDAIALGLRTQAPIRCATKVLEEAQRKQEQAAAAPVQASWGTGTEVDESGPRPIVDTSPESWQEVLENLDASAFGKYKM